MPLTSKEKAEVIRIIRQLKWQENEGNASQAEIDSYRVGIDDAIEEIEGIPEPEQVEPDGLKMPTDTGWWWNTEYQSYVWVCKNRNGKFIYGVYAFVEGYGTNHFFFNVEDSDGKWYKADRQISEV